MKTKLELEISSWQNEIEEVATKLIRDGVSPYDAMDKTREIVSAKRRNNKDDSHT